MLKVWSVSQAKEGNFENKKSVVVYVYNIAKLYVVISCCVDKYTGFYTVVGQNHEYSL